MPATLTAVCPLRRATTALLELLFPRHCVHTGRPMKASDPYAYLSAQALAELEWIEEPVAQRQAMPFNGKFLARAMELQLLEQRHNFRRWCALFAQRGAGRSVVHELKYRNGLYLLPDIVQMVRDCPAAQAFIEGAQLVAVPLHATRERERGFNQSAAITAALARAFGAQQADVLRRIRATRTQTRLSHEQREHNVEGAFALAPGVQVDPCARYVLVDDVFTTGATLNASALALREAGATRVDVFTLGHG